MKTTEYNISFSDLGHLVRSEKLRDMRHQGVCFIWTPVPEFDAEILNIFLPEGHVFGNFRVYRDLRYSERAFHTRYTNRRMAKETYAKLTAIIEATGNAKRSSFAAYALGGLTAAPEFGGGEIDEPLPLVELGGRHCSLVLPACDRPVVARHFQAQLEAFGDSALRQCDESYGNCSFLELQGTAHWNLLRQGLVTLSRDGICALDEAVHPFDSSEGMAALIDQLDPRFAVRGLLSLDGAGSQETLNTTQGEVARVLTFRAQLATRILDLYFLQTYRRAPGHFNGQGMYPAGLQKELLQIIETPIRPYESLIGFQFPSVPLA